MEKFYFEIPSLKRKNDAINYVQELIDNHSEIHGCGGLQNYLDRYEDWLLQLDEDKRWSKKFFTPTETLFLIRKNDDKIIGMVNIRLKLNPLLEESAGHIGYSIRPSERRKGYNKINLYLALKECLNNDILEANIFCAEDNIASKKTILDFDGVLVRCANPLKHQEEKYIISVLESLNKNKDIYEKYVYTLKR